MKILIVGAGSIGVYMGTLLSNAGNDVTLLGRRKLEALSEEISIEGKVYQLPKRVYEMPKDQTFDFIFVVSKLYDLRKNLKSIKDSNLQSKFLISIQNGIVEYEEFEDLIEDTLFTTICAYCGYRIEEDTIHVGQVDVGWKTDDSEAGVASAALLQEAGITCTAEKNIDTRKAEKLILNSCVNVLSANLRVKLYALFHEEENVAVIDKLFDEAYEVLSKDHVMQDKEAFRKRLYHMYEDLQHYSSTCQDAVSGRKSEIDFINGIIIRLGKKYNVPTPTHQKIVEDFSRMYPDSV